MKDLQEIELKAIAAAWANECGGKLAMVFQAELDGLKVGKKWETDQRLFSATKDLFLAHGESEIKHLAWRQKEMLLLCLEVTKQLTKEINPGHALFRTENEENDGPSADEDLRMPPLIEPPYTRSELEKEVTSWYLRTKRDTSFELPEEAYIENAIKDLPASLLYLKWEFTIGTWSQLNLKTTSHSTTSKQKPQAINQANTKWNDPTWAEVEDKPLTKHDAHKLVEGWIANNSNLTTKEKKTMLDNVPSAFSLAHRHASTSHKKEERPFPIRLREASKYQFHRLALVSLGSRGQGGTPAEFRLIKATKSD